MGLNKQFFQGLNTTPESQETIERNQDKAFIVKIIESIERQEQADPCRRMVKAFHEKHGQKAHDDAFYLYGMIAGVIIATERNKSDL